MNQIKPTLFLSDSYFLLEQRKTQLIHEIKSKNNSCSTIRINCDNIDDIKSNVSTLQNFDLFAEKRLIIISNVDGKMHKDAIKTITNYIANNQNELDMIYIFLHALTYKQQKTVQFSKLQEKCITKQIATPNDKQLPGWISKHAKQFSVTLCEDSLYLLALHSKGNLAAIDQCIKKCNLLNLTTLKLNETKKIISNHSIYSIYDYIDSLSKGLNLALTQLKYLKEQKESIGLIIWHICNTFKHTVIIYENKNIHNQSTNQALKGYWKSSQQNYIELLSRLTYNECSTALAYAYHLEEALKSTHLEHTWQQLELFTVALTGEKLICLLDG